MESRFCPPKQALGIDHLPTSVSAVSLFASADHRGMILSRLMSDRDRPRKPNIGCQNVGSRSSAVVCRGKFRSKPHGSGSEPSGQVFLSRPCRSWACGFLRAEKISPSPYSRPVGIGRACPLRKQVESILAFKFCRCVRPVALVRQLLARGGRSVFWRVLDIDPRPEKVLLPSVSNKRLPDRLRSRALSPSDVCGFFDMQDQLNQWGNPPSGNRALRKSRVANVATRRPAGGLEI